MIDMADSTWRQSAPPATAEVMSILTDVYMGLVSLEDGSICSCAESVVSEDSVDGDSNRERERQCDERCGEGR